MFLSFHFNVLFSVRYYFYLFVKIFVFCVILRRRAQPINIQYYNTIPMPFLTFNQVGACNGNLNGCKGYVDG